MSLIFFFQFCDFPRNTMTLFSHPCQSYKQIWVCEKKPLFYLVTWSFSWYVSFAFISVNLRVLFIVTSKHGARCVFFVFIYHTESSNLQHAPSSPTLTLCLLHNIIPHIRHLLTLGFIFQKVTSISYLILLLAFKKILSFKRPEV